MVDKLILSSGDEEVLLEPFYIAMNQVLSRKELLLGQQLSIKSPVSHADVYYMQLSGFLYSEPEAVDQLYVSYPTDWWQAFKERWFPAWAKVRWPVQYTKRILEVKAVYPDFKPQLPKEKVIFKGITREL